MLKSFFKPKWQHKNPDVRIKAIDTLDGLSDDLITLAKSDPDRNVRQYAVQSLLHVPTLKTLAHDRSDNIAGYVKERTIKLVLEEPALAELEQLYNLIDDAEMHKKVAADHQHCAAIRSQAIAEIDDQALLFSIANTDSSKQIQYLAASKLTDYAQLKKLRKFTKTNKSLRNLLKEKGNELQKQQDFLDGLSGLCAEVNTLAETGENQSRFAEIQQQWQQIKQDIPSQQQQSFSSACAGFETVHARFQQEQTCLQPLRDKAASLIQEQDDLVHALKNDAADFTRQDFEQGKQTISSSWAALKPQLPENDAKLWAMRFEERQVSIDKALGSLGSDFKTIEQMKKLCSKAENMLSGKRAIQPKAIADLQKQWSQSKPPIALNTGELQTQFSDTLNLLKARLEKQQSQLDNNVKKITVLLDKMEKNIKEEQFNDAIAAHHNANRILHETHGIDRQTLDQINQRIRAATPSIQNAKSWRHWGTDNARAQLLERATALIADTEIKPLERAEAVKNLRNEWKQFGKMDPGKHQKLWKDFDAACTKAYAPCQAFYKQESVQREGNLDDRVKICEQLEALEKSADWKAVNWKDINKTINGLRNQWRKAGNINRASWKATNQRFNDAMDALEVHLGKERHRNLLQRQNLVTQAEALVITLEKADDIDTALEAAIQQAKALQSQWQPTVTGRRSDENKLWEAFRKGIDGVFDRQRNERNAVNEELSANLLKKQEICKEIGALAVLEGDELLASQYKLVEFTESFNHIRDIPRNARNTIEQQFKQSTKALDEKIQKLAEQQKVSQLLLLGEKSTLCHKTFAGENVEADWAALEPLKNAKLEQQVQQLYASDAFTDEQVQENTQQAQQVLLELEILLGLDTPEAYKQARMQYQVERLSEQMASASEMNQSNEEQAMQKTQDWYLLGAIDQSAEVEIDKRFEPIENWLKDAAR